MPRTTEQAMREPSEFGGKAGRHGVQPPPHEPTESERLRLVYSTGQEEDHDAPHDPLVWEGYTS